MNTLQVVISLVCAVAAVALIVLIVRDREPGWSLVSLLGLIELGLLVQLVLGIVKVSGDRPGVSVPTYVGYLVGALVILPAASAWAGMERSRSGTGVLLVGVLVVPFLCLRLHQVWG